MDDIGIQEEFQREQQRFEAALAFATNPTWVESELRPQPIWKAVELGGGAGRRTDR